jgi:hypothetical protein
MVLASPDPLLTLPSSSSPEDPYPVLLLPNSTPQWEPGFVGNCLGPRFFSFWESNLKLQGDCAECVYYYSTYYDDAAFYLFLQIGANSTTRPAGIWSLLCFCAFVLLCFCAFVLYYILGNQGIRKGMKPQPGVLVTQVEIRLAY